MTHDSSHDPRSLSAFDGRTRSRRVSSRAHRVAVVGGGVAGLVVAYRRMLAGDDVTLIEAGARLGGQLWTDRRDGFVVERGAEGFAPGSDAVRGLACDLGIADEIVSQKTLRSFGFDGKALSLLESGEAPARLGLRAPPGQSGRGIVSFRAGMGELVTALVNAIRDRVAIRLREPVWQLVPSGSTWELGTGSLQRLRADTVVLATSSRVAGDVLRRATGEPTGLERAPVLSSVTVSLAYPSTALGHELDGTGFTVMEAVPVDGCRACTFSSSKLPGRSPNGHGLLRLFFRPTANELETLSDQAWTDRAERVLAQSVGVKGTPLHGWVDRWPDALAVVTTEQREVVAAVERRFRSRGVLLAGGAFHGPGIEGAVRSAEATAAELSSLQRAS
jgi:oxygen-dependent protoporphyrinogen oxidase